jgi:hypothetical protein
MWDGEIGSLWNCWDLWWNVCRVWSWGYVLSVRAWAWGGYELDKTVCRQI